MRRQIDKRREHEALYPRSLWFSLKTLMWLWENLIMSVFRSQAESSVKLRSRAVQGAQQRLQSITLGSECGEKLGYSGRLRISSWSSVRFSQLSVRFSGLNLHQL